jgi:hypothetical protein
MWYSYAIAIVCTAAVCGCNSDAATKSDTLQQTDANSAPAPQNLTLKDVKDLPAKWHEIESKWNGTMSQSVPEPVKSALEKTNGIELTSLHPYQPATLGGEKQDWIYYERRSLGGIQVTDPTTIRFLLAALNEGLGDYDNEEPGPSECYDPRHRIRVMHQGKTINLDICFSCGIVAVYVDGKLDKQQDFYTYERAQQVFDAFLTAGKIPLAPKFVTDGEDQLRL